MNDIVLPKDCVIAMKTVETVDEFIINVITYGIKSIKLKRTDPAKPLLIRTTEELNKKLKDIPENKETWDRIYSEVPNCFLHHTLRMEDAMEGKTTGIIVFTDFVSEQGKKEMKKISKIIKQHKILSQ